MTKRNVPVYNGTLRNHSIRLPHCIRECSGIRIFGMRIKSIAFTTDVAIIKNINADAIIAVYPFTPVSYTHLDVYKRQVFSCVSFILINPILHFY